MNAYNFSTNGCVFYHAIAESEYHAIKLAEEAGFDISEMDIELERTNVKNELGRNYSPKIESAIVI